jgi:hypothetical protein
LATDREESIDNESKKVLFIGNYSGGQTEGIDLQIINCTRIEEKI